ncbi:inorganic diphosphatase [candidate division WWE3 bacterium CG_4_9_14_3_um_filter_34_6]|uniref:Inorganic pyrophosphatase n=1 Tax=candidate division WWE3 bacterium CG_4_9_14_3_um_filter_34_6 TaxID=1975079 RepID=A0A2M7X275_UNCKA|nr:MAG: inorganic diphosphatase [candidate division WWE3 bacterium CG_4_9_14_3_um_filter_34_6]
MNLFHDIKQDKAPEILKLLVEISRGDFVKYEYNHEYGVLEVDRVLHGPVFYPVVYADVPQTWNKHDGDPLDAVIYTSGNIIPGALVYGRVVGVMGMTDNGEKDDKIICVNNKDPRWDFVKDIEDMPAHELKDLKTFMETYKYAQTGPGTVEITGFRPKSEAYQLISESMEEYKVKFSA